VDDEIATNVSEDTDPFVLTTTGPDQVGLVAGITSVLAKFGVNINGLRANVQSEDASQWVMIYEVDVPAGVDRKRFREALYAGADALGQQLSLQHRDIFEAVHRV
jgi:glycine cleavage system transcriptional repressor